jgi:arylsulfatase A-like enzyme
MKSLIIALSVLGASSAFASDKKPNVLFIAVDDLNHYTGFMGRCPQAKTPNIDRLAAMGTAFTHAYCTVPACNPSRASVMSGMRPSTTGLYLNSQQWKNYIKEGQGLNHHFRNNGYYTAAMGKIYHENTTPIDYPSGWDTYPAVPVDVNGSKKRDEVLKYEAYFEPLKHDLMDEDLGDWHTVDFAIEQLRKEHDKPFFIACGLYKPHMPFVVPRKYYDLFPLEEIELPPHREDDLNDVPAIAHTLPSNNEDHKRMLADDRWKSAIQSYLAACAYTDMNIGRLLEALEESGHAENTIIVLWGDHGWHLGEKQKWRKFTLWEEGTRAPLIWVAPGVTQPGSVCRKSVDFLTIYPTLCDLAGLPLPDHVEGKCLRPLLEDVEAEWNEPAITTHGYMNHAVRTDRWRYIRYSDGSEELYDHSKDEYEFQNLASNPEYAAVKKELAALLPVENAPMEKSGEHKKKNKKKVRE